jgi:hypothetical protein
MNDGGEEYARAYFAIQARKAAAANSVKAANVCLHPPLHTLACLVRSPKQQNVLITCTCNMHD